jgi:hypothetical protein
MLTQPIDDVAVRSPQQRKEDRRDTGAWARYLQRSHQDAADKRAAPIRWHLRYWWNFMLALGTRDPSPRSILPPAEVGCARVLSCHGRVRRWDTARGKSTRVGLDSATKSSVVR